jgi:PucR C-terminal helix-turn-helix domain
MTETDPALWEGTRREVGNALRPGIPRAAQRVLGAIRTEIPTYNMALRGEFGREMHAGVEKAVYRFVEAIERHESDLLGPSRSVYYDLGRGEFRRGRTLDALLEAYRIGARVAWGEIVAACEAASIDRHAVYQLAENLIAYINELSAASTEGYSAESAAAAEATQASRQELVELLTLSPAADPRTSQAAAHRARYRLPQRLAAVACRSGEPTELAARVGSNAIGARCEGAVCVLMAEPTEHDEARLVKALRGGDAALGPVVLPEEAARSWSWARQALELLESDAIEARGLVRAEDHLTAIFLREDPTLVAALAARWLAPLQPLPAASRRDLPETLLAWLSRDRDIKRAADDLGCHPNTVRYRLNKLHQIYGATLDDPEAGFELQIALRARGIRAGHPPGAERASRSAGWAV